MSYVSIEAVIKTHWWYLLEGLSFKVKFGSGRSHLNTRNSENLKSQFMNNEMDTFSKKFPESKAEKVTLTSSFWCRNLGKIPLI